MKATAHLVSLALLLLAGLTAAAQGTRLTGKVTDPNGEPVIGAGVVYGKEVGRHSHRYGRKF